MKKLILLGLAAAISISAMGATRKKLLQKANFLLKHWS